MSEPLEYHVASTSPNQLSCDWQSPIWRDVSALELTHFMGAKPVHFPRVRAKLVYRQDSIDLIFCVDDRYVVAVAQQHQEAVCRDSCVEFFFTPGPDVSAGYFNLEVNCGGTILLHYQQIPRQNSVPLGSADIRKIEILHSLPRVVDTEIAEPTTWFVAVRLPFEILADYFPRPIATPAPGVTWCANFYKCADESSHPHWLTWSPVVFERPDFHRPDQFGNIVFD